STAAWRSRKRCPSGTTRATRRLASARRWKRRRAATRRRCPGTATTSAPSSTACRRRPERASGSIGWRCCSPIRRASGTWSSSRCSSRRRAIEALLAPEPARGGPRRGREEGGEPCHRLRRRAGALPARRGAPVFRRGLARRVHHALARRGQWHLLRHGRAVVPAGGVRAQLSRPRLPAAREPDRFRDLRSRHLLPAPRPQTAVVLVLPVLRQRRRAGGLVDRRRRGVGATGVVGLFCSTAD